MLWSYAITSCYQHKTWRIDLFVNCKKELLLQITMATYSDVNFVASLLGWETWFLRACIHMAGDGVVLAWVPPCVLHIIHSCSWFIIVLHCKIRESSGWLKPYTETSPAVFSMKKSMIFGQNMGETRLPVVIFTASDCPRLGFGWSNKYLTNVLGLDVSWYPY